MDLEDAIMKAVDVERYSQIQQATGSKLTTMGLFNIPATTASSQYDARTKQDTVPPAPQVPETVSVKTETSGSTTKKVQCQYCRVNGHEADKCFKLQRQLLFCTSCHKRGHEAEKCRKNRGDNDEQNDSNRNKGNRWNSKKKYNDNNSNDKSEKKADTNKNQQPKKDSDEKKLISCSERSSSAEQENELRDPYGSYRMVTIAEKSSGHRLNEITEGYCYPLTLTVDILERLATANYISCVDLRSGFHQIAMDKDSAYKTGFMGPNGVYQFRRMSMGLKSGPSVFSRAMSLALVELQGTELEIYLDDVMVHGETIEEHNKRFIRMMNRFKAANMSIEPAKCQMLKREAKVLGHIVGNGEIRMDPENISAMKDFPAPTNAKKLKQFLGLAGYYRKFIKNYASIARPLRKFLKKTVQFKWTDEQSQAFADLKARMCEYPVLRAPDMSKQFILTTDASEFAVSAILGQGDIGSDYVCAYASRGLKSAELRYATYDKELLAVVYELRGYDFDIVYRKGLVNANADALSRNPVITDGQNLADFSWRQLYELADNQEDEGIDLIEEINHPPGRIFKLRTRRIKNKEGVKEKVTFDDGASEKSTRSLEPVTKHRAIQHEALSEYDASDSDVSMGEPRRRAAKTSARAKITEIYKSYSRPRKSPVQVKESKESPAAPEIPAEPAKSTQSLATQPLAAQSQKLPDSASESSSELPPKISAVHANVYARATHSPSRGNTTPTDIDERITQSSAPECIYSNSGPQTHTRRSFPEIAREISAKLRVDLKESHDEGRKGLQINIWEIDTENEKSYDQKLKAKINDEGDAKVINQKRVFMGREVSEVIMMK
ncbi:unnamed protein product [Trichogramma brassicae]|uniref:RNA-directed DNA polymerase n=1 Tax=Trichogramma brassicae TaxID=86971 RepID=A0A6H5IQ33_9HYME|nr:unnamed protein product [Trichogramma brassicae]